MSELTLHLHIRVTVEEGGMVRLLETGIENPPQPDQPPPGLPGDIPVDVAARLAAEAPPSTVGIYAEYLAECVRRFQGRLALPATGARPYVNVYPPTRYGRARIAALHLRSGRLQVNLPTSLADRWSLAEVVSNHGVPVYLKIGLHSARALEQALDMTAAALGGPT